LRRIIDAGNEQSWDGLYEEDGMGVVKELGEGRERGTRIKENMVN